jgi:nucleoside-diphosphate-sugar epimerase
MSGSNKANQEKQMLLRPENLPDTISDIDALDDLLCRPSQPLIDDLNKVDGDIMILGVAGKMGPTLAGLAKAASPHRRVIGVARFSDPSVKAWLEGRGIETINCDLLDEAAIEALPKSPNVVFMAGRKFGAEGDLSLTWAMNAHVPALVAQAFPQSRIVAFSTGCVYPFVPVTGKGADESMAPDPPGEYAQSCVGRERMFEYFSRKFATPGRLFRLNYAIDMRYGVLHDIATKILQGKPIDVSLGHVNFIWQGDAASQALRCLAHCETPTSPINVSGHELLAVRDLAAKLGQRLDRKPILVGTEQPTAWLTDTSLAVKLFGLPIVDTQQLIDWTADWVARSMPSLGKPTKYEVRDGRY